LRVMEIPVRMRQTRMRPVRWESPPGFNGHYACTCYHPLFVFNQFGDLERPPRPLCRLPDG
jgi:hypothetical protein